MSANQIHSLPQPGTPTNSLTILRTFVVVFTAAEIITLSFMEFHTVNVGVETLAVGQTILKNIAQKKAKWNT